jgi:Domain of unknown function (DUF1772)
MTPAMAHALELPGKMRLAKKAYVQPIYYPGFTIAGIAEPIGLVVLLLLVFLTPLWTAAFWLTLAGFVAMLAMHLLYWLLTHPVNNFWLADFKPKGLGASFFGDPFGRTKSGKPLATPNWTILRDRWEYSHAARAILALISLILIVIAFAL